MSAWLRAVPADHLHAHAFADARDLAADAAEPDHAQRLAEQLHALVRRPDAGAHLAVHARDVARGGHHQRDRVLGHRGVAVALDDVHLDAARFQFADIHVARGSGAEEHDVLELLALRHQFGRHVGVVVDGDVVAGEHARQFFARKRSSRLTSIFGSSARITRSHTGANWSLQSRKMVFMPSV